MKASHAENTNKKYNCYFNKWKRWCEQFDEVKLLPADECHIALFLASLYQQEESADVIELCYYAIQFHHKLYLADDIFPSVLCQNIVKAAKRNRKKKKKKEPITVNDLHKVFKLTGEKDCSLLDLRTSTMMVLSFVGFLRYSEVSELCDFEFHETYLRIFIEKSKTDIYRDGHWLFIAKLDSNICPVKLSKLYLSRTEIKPDSEEYLFRAVTYFKRLSKHKLRKNNLPISYSSARQNMLTVLDNVGLNSKNFGLHSLRSGGATVATNNGVKDRLFKRHGRWKSDKAKDGYVKDDLVQLLSVSENLGL